MSMKLLCAVLLALGMAFPSLSYSQKQDRGAAPKGGGSTAPAPKAPSNSPPAVKTAPKGTPSGHTGGSTIKHGDGGNSGGHKGGTAVTPRDNGSPGGHKGGTAVTPRDNGSPGGHKGGTAVIPRDNGSPGGRKGDGTITPRDNGNSGGRKGYPTVTPGGDRNRDPVIRTVPNDSRKGGPLGPSRRGPGHGPIIARGDGGRSGDSWGTSTPSFMCVTWTASPPCEGIFQISSTGPFMGADLKYSHRPSRDQNGHESTPG